MDNKKAPTRLLTYREAALLLGITEGTLREYVYAGRVPFLKLGATLRAPVRFDPDELMRWAAENAARRPA